MFKNGIFIMQYKWNVMIIISILFIFEMLKMMMMPCCVRDSNAWANFGGMAHSSRIFACAINKKANEHAVFPSRADLLAVKVKKEWWRYA